MLTLGIQRRYPDFLPGSDILHERQVNRRGRQSVFLEPPSERAQQRSVVEIQVWAIAKELELLVAGFSHGFQQIHGDRAAAVDLRRDSKLHDTHCNAMISGMLGRIALVLFLVASSAQSRTIIF